MISDSKLNKAINPHQPVAVVNIPADIVIQNAHKKDNPVNNINNSKTSTCYDVKDYCQRRSTQIHTVNCKPSGYRDN